MTIWGLTGARNQGTIGLVGNGENAPDQVTFAVFGPEQGLWGWIKSYVSRMPFEQNGNFPPDRR